MPSKLNRERAASLEMADSPTLQIIQRSGRKFGRVDARKVEASMALLRVAKRLLSSFVGHFAEAGISPGKYTILAILFEHGAGLPPSVLAKRSGVTRATVTGLIDGLERDGYVERTARPSEDRRTVLITLTDKGARFMTGFLPGHLDRLESITRALNDKELKALLALLERVERGLGPLRIEQEP